MKLRKVSIVIIFIVFLGIIFINNHVDYTIKSVDYNGNNLKISIDGSSANALPTSGTYYLASYDCESDETEISWNMESYELKVSNGNKKSGISCYLDFQTNPLLYYMEKGSYVKYVGDNNCPEGHCDGTNANYVSSADMGSCYNNDFKFKLDGWRVAYKENASAYLISAGAPECVCTDSNGSMFSSGCSSSGTSQQHIQNLNNIALHYCNSSLVFGGECNSSNSWSMKEQDLEKILNVDFVFNDCWMKSSSACGFNNDFIDIGGEYWIASEISTDETIAWDGIGFHLFGDADMFYSYKSYGVRPVIKLDSNVVVTGGSGTYEDPYTIGNNTFTIDETSLVSDGDSRIVTLNLVALDTVEKMCVNVDSSSCSNYVDVPESNTYSLDLSRYGTGERTIYVYYKNANGKIVASMHKSVTLS